MIKDAMEKNANTTAADREMAVLKEHFPGCFHGEEFDLEAFARLIGMGAKVVREGYGLSFLGRDYGRLVAARETETVLVPDEAHNAKPENRDSRNLYVTGDNLDALKHLLGSYAGAVKCIYIDPPYNTGSDGFVYNDSFSFTAPELSEKLGVSEEEAARVLDLTHRSSASHSAWLLFLYPRLLLARELLASDGVIFISIDDNEQANLKLLCDEVFGEEHFVANMVWEGAFKNDAQKIGTNHEYVLVYTRQNTEGDPWAISKVDSDAVIKEANRLVKIHKGDFAKASDDLAGWFRANKAKPVFAHRRFHLIDAHGVYKEDDPTAPGGRHFDLINPRTGGIIPLRKNRGWRFDQQTFETWVAQGKISFISETSVMVRTYLHETETVTPQSVFYQPARSASERLRRLFGSDVFSFPKDETIISQFLEMGTNKDSIVVDFFAGSATTAHAVMSLNARDGGTRRFILVQLPENLDTKLSNATGLDKEILQNAITFLDSLCLPHELNQIGLQRIKLAAAKIREESPLFHGDLGFKHYRLASPTKGSVAKMWDFKPDSLVEDSSLLTEFGESTVLATWLAHDGYGLSAEPAEVDFAGYKGRFIGRHLYFTRPGLTDEAVLALCERIETDPAFNPENLVLFGYSFPWSALEHLRINLARSKSLAKNLVVRMDVRY